MGTAPDNFLEEFRTALEQSARSHAVLAGLDDRRKRLLSQLTLDYVEKQGLPITKADHKARADQVYGEFLDQADDARHKAEMDRSRVEWMRIRYEMWRTTAATKRAELSIGGR